MPNLGSCVGDDSGLCLTTWPCAFAIPDKILHYVFNPIGTHVSHVLWAKDTLVFCPFPFPSTIQATNGNTASYIM